MIQKKTSCFKKKRREENPFMIDVRYIYNSNIYLLSLKEILPKIVTQRNTLFKALIMFRQFECFETKCNKQEVSRDL